MDRETKLFVSHLCYLCFVFVIESLPVIVSIWGWAIYFSVSLSTSCDLSIDAYFLVLPSATVPIHALSSPSLQSSLLTGLTHSLWSQTQSIWSLLPAPCAPIIAEVVTVEDNYFRGVAGLQVCVHTYASPTRAQPTTLSHESPTHCVSVCRSSERELSSPHPLSREH